MDSIVCLGSVLSGGRVERSVLGPRTRVNSYAQVEDSILFEGVDIGRRAKVRRAIIDKGVKIPAGARIGWDLEEDAARGFAISPSGIVVIAKSDGVEQILADTNVTAEATTIIEAGQSVEIGAMTATIFATMTT